MSKYGIRIPQLKRRKRRLSLPFATWITPLQLSFLIFVPMPIMARAQERQLPPCLASAPTWDRCQGTRRYTNGIYVGEFKDGKRNGKGTATLAAGETYVGEWKDDKFNGHGTLTLATGETYAGEWKDGKRNGRGAQTFPDGGK